MTTDEPKIPVRTDITVLEGDDSTAAKIGWEVKEYDGVPLYRGPEGMAPEDLHDHGLPDGFALAPIPASEEIKAGDVVLWAALMGGYHIATIHRDVDDFIAQSRGGYVGFLRRGGDDRNCWVCWGGASLDAIERLEIER